MFIPPCLVEARDRVLSFGAGQNQLGSGEKPWVPCFGSGPWHILDVTEDLTRALSLGTLVMLD